METDTGGSSAPSASSGPSSPGRPGEASIAGLRWIEVGGLLAALAGLAFLLVTRYSVSPISDPVQWFAFGRNFAAEFSSRELAYGFPLLLSGAIALVGPYVGFLVNIPVLVLVGGALYGFSRACAASDGSNGGDAGAVLAGAVALALFVSRDPTWIVHLANPYRDPLAFLCMLVAGILVLRFVSGRSRSLAALAGAGVALAYASSTRETSVLFLGPLLLFALLARRRDAALPFARGFVVFTVAFVLAAAPYLVQNQLVSGHALVPGQAADTFEESARLVPGVRLTSMSDTLPAVLRHLRDHFGALGGVLLALGLVAAIVRRNLAILGLCVPAVLTYVIFYGAYNRAVPRYLLVVDLFALPIAGAGAGFILDWLRSDRSLADRKLAKIGGSGLIARLGVGVGFALAIAASLLARGTTLEKRVRVSGVEGFIEHVRTMIPEDALVLGGRPTVDVLYTFLPNRISNVANLVPSRRLEDPALPAALRATVGEAGETRFVSRYDAARILMQREYDLARVGRILPSEFGMDRPLQGDYLVLIDRVMPWQRKSVRVSVVSPGPGRQVLSLDLGHLSQYPRTHARVTLGDQLLDEHPRDGINFYEVEVPHGATASVRIHSDAPLPARPEAQLQPADKKLVLEFSEGAGPRNRERLSASLRVRPKRPYPTLERSGTITIPTLTPHDAAFLVDLELDLPFEEEPYAQVIEGWIGRKRVYQGRRSVAAAESGKRAAKGKERNVFTLSMTVSDRDVEKKDTPLEVRLLENPDEPASRLLSVRSVSVRRQPLSDAFTLDLAAEKIPTALIRGFYPPHDRYDRGTAPGRWTGGAASARVFLRDAAGPARLEVVYWLGGRSAPARPAKPVFMLHGRKLQGTKTREIRDGDVRVRARFEIPTHWGLRPAEILEIRTRPWVPRDTGSSEDPRSLGVRIESISLERLASSSG